MSTKTRTTRASISVERAMPGAAPDAFRIWMEGEVITEHGTFLLTRENAEAIVAKHRARGVKVPFDINHLSHDESTPLENRGAVGWHDLEAREGENGIELWAVNCEWDPEVKAGLEAKPPRWRYFSPVFTVEDRTIVGYLDTALTNTPATHGIQSIAASRGGERVAAARLALARATSTWAADDVCMLTRALSAANDDEKDTNDEPKEDKEKPMKTIDEVIDALLAIASDDQSAPDVRAKAKRALEALQADPEVETKTKARAALTRLAGRERIQSASAAHVTRRGGVEHRGTRTIFHTMTPSEARAELARRSRMGGAR